MDSKRQWTLLTAIACLAIIVAGWFVAVKPQRTHAAQVRTQVASARQQTQELRAKLALLQDESRNLTSKQAELARIVQQLPNDPQLPGLIRTLDAAAKSAHVDLVNVAPSAPTLFTQSAALAPPKVAPASPAATASAPAADATVAASTASPLSNLAAIPVVLTVSGSFFDMEQFIDKLEGLSRSTLVDGFTIATRVTGVGTPGPVQPGQGELQVTINTRVFETTAAAGLSGATAAAAAAK